MTALRRATKGWRFRSDSEHVIPGSESVIATMPVTGVQTGRAPSAATTAMLRAKRIVALNPGADFAINVPASRLRLVHFD
ncbi:hypothetical protein PCAR4_570114 [Paraburkholderia caribensis]|nr:hypothetical protein PCAR4_570114 [Paraburkholderia caribensis]